MFMPTFDEQKLLEQRIRELRRELEANLERYTALKGRGESSPRIRTKRPFSDLLSKILAKA